MFKVGDLVKFNTIQDDSCMASDCFGFDPSCGNDWFDVQVYVEDFYGEVVAKGTVEIIYVDGKRSGKFYTIKNGRIKGETERLLSIKRGRGLTFKSIFEDSGIRSLKQFQEILKVSKLQLSNTRIRRSCITDKPKKDSKVSIWKPHGTVGYEYLCETVFVDTWDIDIESGFVWEVTLERIYVNGKIFVEQY